MICKFLIDRLYSATYVNKPVDNALDLTRAMMEGRVAVNLSHDGSPWRIPVDRVRQPRT